MKVVILAGGLGTRMREETEFRPKPMVELGGEPLVWHLMKNFARYGFDEFVICAGYKKEIIEDFFDEKNWATKSRHLIETHDFGGVPETEWSIDVVDTGLDSPTGGRLLQIEHLTGDEPFFCTYGDSVAGVDISSLLLTHRSSGGKATVTLSRPTSRFGVAEIGADGRVTSFREKPVLNDLVSIGFFVFEKEIFKLLSHDSTLENEPLSTLAREDDLFSFQHHGFWQPIDTFRELQIMNNLWASGERPWLE